MVDKNKYPVFGFKSDVRVEINSSGELTCSISSRAVIISNVPECSSARDSFLNSIIYQR